MEEFLGVTRWMLRLTDDKSIEEIETYIKEIKPHKYIIGSELSVKGKRHFHIFLEGVYEQQELKKFINEKGYSGNKMYNLKKADNSNKVKRYCIKDGDFLFYGVCEELMESWKKLAHKKVKDGYSEELQKLEEKYVRQISYTDNSFGTDLIMLKVKYGLKPNRRLHVEYMDYMRVKKYGRSFASELHNKWIN